MITVLKRGEYRLYETKHQIKILELDSRKSYAWIRSGIGEFLVITQRKHAEESVFSVGNYRLYDIKGEQELSDQMHLELCIGSGKWQGYLLPTGFPTDMKKRSRIIPTKELITLATEEVCSQALGYYE